MRIIRNLKQYLWDSYNARGWIYNTLVRCDSKAERKEVIRILSHSLEFQCYSLNRELENVIDALKDTWLVKKINNILSKDNN
jgi:hypothetical protein